MSDTVTFSDEILEKSVRRRAEYDDSRPCDLVLRVPKRTGGEIVLTLLENARSNIEREDYQENTLLRVKPVAEVANNLPVKSGGVTVYTGKGVGLLRPGYLYIFRGQRLWRELEIDASSQMSDVDLARFREEATTSAGQPHRESEGQWLSDVLVPVFLQGQSVVHECRMAYSEVQWSWDYIQQLESDTGALETRTTDVAPAWAAVTFDTLSFEGGFPASGIEQVAELRPRDLGVELMLENPCDFAPAFTGPADGELCTKLKDRIHQIGNGSIDLDLSCETLPDTLAGLRQNKGMVCVSIPDPLFQLRHALAQLHLALHYLDAIDITLKDKPLAHSAMLIRQAVFDPAPNGQGGDLANYREAINREQLDNVLETAERNHAIRTIEEQVRRLKRLMESAPFNAVLDDYLQSPDIAACEALLLCADNLNVLQQIPGVLKAQGVADDQGIPSALARWLSDESRLAKWSPGVVAGAGEEDAPSSPYKRLRSLAGDQSEINEQHLSRLNLQALAYLEKQSQYGQKSTEEQAANQAKDAGRVGALVSGALGEWSTAVLIAGRRLMEDDKVEAIQVHRIMQAAAANAILSDPNLTGVELMRRGDVDPTQHSIIGVEGEGIRRGLTDFDRSQGLLTRANDYLYADLVDRSGAVQGSTSPARASDELDEAIKKIAGNTWVYVVPAGHPEARKLGLLKVDLAKRVGAVVDGPAVSRGLVALAAFNVFLEGWAWHKAYQANDGKRGLAVGKFAGAIFDLTAASMKLSIVAHETAGIDLAQSSKFYRFSSRPLFDMKGWLLIGKRLANAGANTLVRTAGLVSFVAGGMAVGLSYWDMRISLSQGDHDAANGHGIAIAGGLIFLSAPLMAGLLAIPGWGWAILGMSLALGGSLYAGSATDDLFEKVLKQGPLGTHPQESLVNLDDSAYYGQLLTLLSPVNVSARRYADVDPDPALTNPGHPPQPDDYVITLQTPLVSRLKVFQERLPNLPSQPFKIVVQEIAYTNSRVETANVAVGTVEQEVMSKVTPLTQVVARQSLPHESAVRFLVKRELQDSSYQGWGYEETVSTTVRVGLQVVVDTELGPVVFPTPVLEHYEPYAEAQHGGAPGKRSSVFDPRSEPLVPYWSVREVAV